MSVSILCRVILSSVAFLVFFASSAEGQDEADLHPYREVKIFFSNSDGVVKLAEEGLILDHPKFDKQPAGGFSMTAVVNNIEFGLLKSMGFPFEVLVEDLEAEYTARPPVSEQEKQAFLRSSPEGFEFGSMGGYYTYVQVAAELDSMRLLYPNLITVKQSIGSSHEFRPIWMVKISDNPDVDENEPEVLYDALHHAREPQGMMGLIYFMYYLLENYGSDPDVTYLVDNRELFFVPVVNPDGYYYNEFTDPNGGGMWRKNRRNNGGSFGVDLNRNYGYQWGYDNNGSSPTPSSETYRGPSAFSEPETQALRDFIIARDFVTGSTIHTYQDIYLYAYGYTSIQPEDLDVYTQYASDMSAWTGYPWGTPWELLYFSNGRTQDWQYHEHGIVNIEPEIGSSSDGFWPQINRIVPLAQLHVQPNLYLAWVAGSYVEYRDFEFSEFGNQNGYPDPGETIRIVFKLKNIGQADASGITFNLFSNDSYLTIDSSISAGVTTIPGWTESASDTFVLSIASNTPPAHAADLTLKVTADGITRQFAVDNLLIGTPRVELADDAESGIGSWSTGQGWGTTNTTSHSPIHSFADSPFGNYNAGANNSLTLVSPIDLSNAVSAYLQFWTRWDIEASWDFAQVLASTNGSTWTPLNGQYTTPGSGQGVQPANQPGYDGTRTDWVREHIDLSAYAGVSQLYLRFNLKADGGVQEDGWYVDDIELFAFGTDPVPVLNLSATSIDFDSVAVNAADTLALTVSNVGTADLWITPSINSDGTFFLPDSSSFVVNPGTSSDLLVAFKPFTQGVFTDTLFLATNDPLVPAVEVDLSGLGFVLTDISDGASIPEAFSLDQNFPNPFNPTTSIKYTIGVRSRVDLRIFDILGQEVRSLVSEVKNPGKYEVVWDGKNNVGKQVPSGVYFYRLQTAQYTETRKMLFVK